LSHSQPTQPKRRLLIRLLPVLLPLLILLGTGLTSLDFGDHPDEGNKIGEVRRMLDKGIFIPTFYKKPSIVYYAVIAALAPDVPAILQQSATAEEVDRDGDQPLSLMPTAATFAETDRLKPRVRAISLVISALAVVWVYALVLSWRDNWLEALLAASLLSLSWEWAYHLRWIAADGYMAMFAILTYLLLWLYYRQPEKRGYLWGAAAAAGLAVSSKYNMGLLLIPLLLTVYFTWDKASRRTLLIGWRNVIGVFVLAYLITTPGTIYAPEYFVRGVVYEVTHYADGHRNHTVVAGLPHLLKNLQYLATAFLSPYNFLALPLFLVGGLGIFAIYREDRRWLLVLLSFPLIYLLYMSTQSVLFVRNLLPLMPIIAILSARGVFFIVEQVKLLPLRYAMGALLLVILGANALWLVDAANRINARNADPLGDPFFDEFVAYVQQHPDQVFSVTHDVWFSMVADRQIEAPPNVRRLDWDSPDVDFMVISQNELRREIPVAEPEIFYRIYHQRDINPVYYPSFSGSSWAGERRVILVPIDVAHRFNLPAMWDEKYGDSDG